MVEVYNFFHSKLFHPFPFFWRNVVENAFAASRRELLSIGNEPIPLFCGNPMFQLCAGDAFSYESEDKSCVEVVTSPDGADGLHSLHFVAAGNVSLSAKGNGSFPSGTDEVLAVEGNLLTVEHIRVILLV